MVFWAALLSLAAGIGLLVYVGNLRENPDDNSETVNFEKEKKKFYEYMGKLDYRPWQIDECILSYKTASDLKIANKKLAKAIKKLE